MSNFKLLSAILFCFLWGWTPLAANPFLVTEESDYIYGKGVHAFFDQNYDEAVTILSRAEAINTEDPRPFYFLGLAHLRQNQTAKADEYFKKAAQLEYSGRALRDYAISESLRRIQGAERQRIENIRAAERVNARVREERIREARYGSDTAAAREALRNSLPRVPNEDVAALRAVDGFGENAFDVNPVNPIGTPEEHIVTRRADTAGPFGGLAASAGGETETSDTAQPSLSELLGAVAVPERAPSASIDVALGRASASSTVRTGTGVANQTNRDFNPIGIEAIALPALAVSPSSVVIQSDAPRQLGRALGTLFSRRASSE